MPTFYPFNALSGEGWPRQVHPQGEQKNGRDFGNPALGLRIRLTSEVRVIHPH
jgi:hypothetical protein